MHKLVSLFWAHPRSRGENKDGAGKDLIRWGSSPLTRGKPLLTPHATAHTGLIPAHAGKTICVTWALGSTVAHPRSRGENHTGRWAGRGLQGSSPLTRGKHDGQGAVVADGGLIPAHAGKTPR